MKAPLIFSPGQQVILYDVADKGEALLHRYGKGQGIPNTKRKGLIELGFLKVSSLDTNRVRLTVRDQMWVDAMRGKAKT